MEVFAEEQSRFDYSTREKDTSEVHRQTAMWLNYFGAHRLAYEVIAATLENKWAQRASALAFYDSAAARDNDVETVLRAQTDLGLQSLAAFELRTQLFAAQNN